jgi:type I restriction enzyme R subunit
MPPEQKARIQIDALLEKSGWTIQDRQTANPKASVGVAVREFLFDSGEADYGLFVDGKAIGAIEAKKAGTTLSSVAFQTQKYLTSLPETFSSWQNPLPFGYESTGTETFFADLRDPDARSRPVFSFHRPETLREWVQQPDTLRERLRRFPQLPPFGLRDCQRRAIHNLEDSFAANRPRALIQMATGAGKTFTAITFCYRLIKFAKASRILFLVDRRSLGIQAEGEFRAYQPVDTTSKLSELYTIQHLQSNVVEKDAKVVIGTIQRIYSMLTGKPDFDPANEERSGYEIGAGDQVLEVGYNKSLPPEFFDFIVIDECHRSIYKTWRQVLEYFDAFQIGLTATPSKLTFGFFNRNVVSEYSYDDSVADGVNVGYDVYRLRTQVGTAGASLEENPEYLLGKRDRQTRQVRWESMDDDLAYTAQELDRSVVAEDQIRTVIRTFRDRLFTDVFPGRTVVPKTLIFAKDDSHAEDVTRIVREEFGKGNDFCKKITYSAQDPQGLIKEFRTQYNPRIAVSVDMISTGTDIRPLECLLFMRDVKSATYYEQMKGRGCRTISADDLLGVTKDAGEKTHFVLIDAVGVTESCKKESQPLDRKKNVPIEKLMERIIWGERSEENLSSLAARLARLNVEATPAEQAEIQSVAGGADLPTLAHRLVQATDPDTIQERARASASAQGKEEPEPEDLSKAAAELAEQATAPFNEPKLRTLLADLRRRREQTIDTITQDVLLEFGPADRTGARETAEKFRDYIERHKDEIAALQILLNRPYVRRHISYAEVKDLAQTLVRANPRFELGYLWSAYQRLSPERVRNSNPVKVLTDLISLVRFAVDQEPVLKPYPETVEERFEAWLAKQGDRFTAPQIEWLRLMKEHIATSLSVSEDDFELTPFVERGGAFRAHKLFGDQLPAVVNELVEVLAA